MRSAGISQRPFRSGDAEALAEAWTRAMPADPITADRFRRLCLWDRNVDPAGLSVAEADGRPVGAAYAVRRRDRADDPLAPDDVSATRGWILFLFVDPEHRGAGIGTALLRRSLDWLAGCGVREVDFAAYPPNYYLPGLDAERYPAAAALLRRFGFAELYQAVAMDRSLVGYRVPEHLTGRCDELREQGWAIGTPTGDDVVDLLEIAAVFGADWPRTIREAVVGGLPLDRIMTARDPGGAMRGWAMCGAYDGVIDRFGPFGVVPAARGTGLGELLLHLTLQRMVGLGAHGAWFLWTSEDSAAGRLYHRAGFAVTRRFSMLRRQLDDHDHRGGGR